MALRDKLKASRKRQSLGVLREELSKNQDMRDQLENLVKRPHPPDEAETAMALYSASWYNTRVRDQLEMVANRCTHLDEEVQTMQTELARAEQQRAKKQERADELTSQAKKTAQDKADERLAELRTRPLSTETSPVRVLAFNLQLNRREFTSAFQKLGQVDVKNNGHIWQSSASFKGNCDGRGCNC